VTDDLTARAHAMARDGEIGTPAERSAIIGPLADEIDRLRALIAEARKMLDGYILQAEQDYENPHPDVVEADSILSRQEADRG